MTSFKFNPQNPFDCFIVQSESMKSAVENAKRFAMFDAPLLIQGETGTGKDLLAKACHYQSLRRDKKFIAVNCAGLPDEDAESEMFGRKVGDSETIGFFEYANEGTVLLDGIAELSLSLQAKLLRFLTDGSFRRVGEEKEHHANVRVICTSQVPLHLLVEQGNVRADLFHRLNVLTINVPALRDRMADIEPLAQGLLQEISEELKIAKPTFDKDFLLYLQKYDWKGNVRELYNTLYRACSLVQDNHLTIESLNLAPPQSAVISLGEFDNKTLDEIIGSYESQVLKLFYAEYPSTRKLAQRLGVSHTAIANKLKQYGIGK
ncbi:sigma 54-interacting transcriptional regulator [Haemophilus haemolyticus]|uniref:sigma 54-interacting transcriptional regulator n=1 Tax=Haemophilus haemolyticus TaxID=726 RepID=UPI00025E644F|nr:sigma 54-interacting transcriptional regulator [Haemophilus haemolyticus]EIJ74093.1 sigma-54 interaction domain protein [Haemophilus haemolyticus HK386]OBX40174.1 transcriptional regulator [Haemophilus haemolyticus]